MRAAYQNPCRPGEPNLIELWRMAAESSPGSTVHHGNFRRANRQLIESSLYCEESLAAHRNSPISPSLIPINLLGLEILNSLFSEDSQQFFALIEKLALIWRARLPTFIMFSCNTSLRSLCVFHFLKLRLLFQLDLPRFESLHSPHGPK